MENTYTGTMADALVSATPAHCLELMSAICIDLKNAEDPKALHIRLGAHSYGRDVEEHRELIIHQLVRDFQLVLARYAELKGIR